MKKIVLLITAILTAGSYSFAKKTTRTPQQVGGEIETEDKNESSKYVEKQLCDLTIRKGLNVQKYSSAALFKESKKKLYDQSFGISHKDGTITTVILIANGANDAYEMTVRSNNSNIDAELGLETGKIYSAGPVYLNGERFIVFKNTKIKIVCGTVTNKL